MWIRGKFNDLHFLFCLTLTYLLTMKQQIPTANQRKLANVYHFSLKSDKAFAAFNKQKSWHSSANHQIFFY